MFSDTRDLILQLRLGHILTKIPWTNSISDIHVHDRENGIQIIIKLKNLAIEYFSGGLQRVSLTIRHTARKNTRSQHIFFLNPT